MDKKMKALALLLQRHAHINGMSRSLKLLRQSTQLDIAQLEANVKGARSDYRHFGMYDDCGDSYRDSLQKAEAQLDQGKNAAKHEARLVQEIIQAQWAYTKEKHAFKAEFGDEALQELYALTAEFGKQTHQDNLDSARLRKLKMKVVKNVHQFIFGQNFDRKLRGSFIDKLSCFYLGNLPDANKDDEIDLAIKELKLVADSAEEYVSVIAKISQDENRLQRVRYQMETIVRFVSALPA